MMSKPIITFILTLFITNSMASSYYYKQDLCCKEEGEKLGLYNCGCRDSCGGYDCTRGSYLGIRAKCGSGVCACGDQCKYPVRPELDSCPTENPSRAPTSDPTSDPTMNPVVVCPEYNPPESSTNSGGSNIPIPDFDGSPKLCQLGRSGTWTSLDKFYSFDCSCYDTQTRYNLGQLVLGWFYEFSINFKQPQDGRFEAYFENYGTDDMSMQTSISNQPESAGPNWSDLDGLTSCDPDEPGYGEFTRKIAESLQFNDVISGILIRECIDSGNLAIAHLRSDTHRTRDGITENQVVYGDFILQRQEYTNIWLIKEIKFVGETVGYSPIDPPDDYNSK